MRRNETRRGVAIAVLSVLATVAAAADCPQPVASRLKAEGYSAKRQAELCGIATALGRRGIVVQVRAALFEELERSTFPLTFGSDKSALIFASGRYCKAAGEHAAELIAVSLRASDGSPLKAADLEATDCTAGLAAVAARLSHDGQEAVVARIRVTWTPWKLTTSIIDAATVTPPPPGWQERRAQLLAHPLPPSSMTGIQLPLSQGTASASQSAVVYFLDNAMTIVMGRENELAAVKDTADVPSLRALIGSRLNAARGNGSIVLNHEAVNAFASDVLSQAPFPVGTNLPLFDNVNVRTFSVRGAVDSYDLLGKLVDGAGETYTGRISLRGSDLALSDLKIEATCDPSDLLCPLRRGAAEVITGVATERLQERNGRAWLDYVEKRPFDIPWTGATIRLTAKVEQTASDDEALMMHANFTLTRIESP